MGTTGTGRGPLWKAYRTKKAPKKTRQEEKEGKAIREEVEAADGNARPSW